MIEGRGRKVCLHWNNLLSSVGSGNCNLIKDIARRVKISSVSDFLSFKLEIWSNINAFKDETTKTTDLQDLLGEVHVASLSLSKIAAKREKLASFRILLEVLPLDLLLNTALPDKSLV